jgi:DNA-binding MarR family transcriptional regulator
MSASQPNNYQFSEQIGHLLRRAYQRHMAIFQETVPDSTLTPSQFVVLCTVRDQPGCEIAAIVRATALDEPSVRGIVERLKWRGLLSVEQEPGDGRHMKMTLTEEGRQLAAKTVPFAEQISELTYGDLSADERAQLARLVRRISGI